MKVMLNINKRYFEPEDADFFIKGGEIKEILGKHFKSYEIKDALISGYLKLIEGEIILNIKHAKVLFDSETPDLCYGIEFGKFFKKKLDTGETFWIANDEVSENVYQKLTGEIKEQLSEEESDEPEEEVSEDDAEVSDESEEDEIEADEEEDEDEDED